MNAIRVITQMSKAERLGAIRERPDLLFKVIGADEKEQLMAGEVEAEKLENDLRKEERKGISIRSMSYPVDLEKLVEEL